MMAMKDVATYQQAALAPHRDGDELERVFLEEGSGGFEQRGFLVFGMGLRAGGLRHIQHGEYLRDFKFVQLEDGGRGKRVCNDARIEERRAQVYIEDADTFGARGG